MSMNEMESKIRELRQIQALIDEATAEAEAIKDTIKATMTAQGADELRAGEYQTVTASRLDAVALKKALPDMAAQFKKATHIPPVLCGVKDVPPLWREPTRAAVQPLSKEQAGRFAIPPPLPF